MTGPTRAPADPRPAARRPMRLLRLDCSIRVEGSASRSLADVVQRDWQTALPRARFVHRDLGRHPLPPVWPDALAGTTSAPRPDDAPVRTASEAATELATELVDELLGCDGYLLAVPMYNFGVPQQLKHWIDMVITDPRAADVSRPLLPGRPALLVVAKGGGYGPGSPRAGWDHATPYLRRILSDVWGLRLTVVEVELTAADSTPAMSHLRELARRRLSDARAEAAEQAARTSELLRAHVRSVDGSR